jgi:hypothetical protein
VEEVADRVVDRLESKLPEIAMNVLLDGVAGGWEKGYSYNAEKKESDWKYYSKIDPKDFPTSYYEAVSGIVKAKAEDVWEERMKDFDDRVNAEKFVDDIVNRINSKQLGAPPLPKESHQPALRGQSDYGSDYGYKFDGKVHTLAPFMLN